MRRIVALAVAALAAGPIEARAGELSPASSQGATHTLDDSGGDLFAIPGRVSLSAATGLPFLGIGEAALGFTHGVAIGVVGGVTPSVLTAGIRPRFRVRTSDRVSLVLVVPMLYYPSASAPGPGNIGRTSWVLTRPEVFLDGEVTERLHVAGGMGIIAAASTVALANKAEGKPFALPAYAGSTDTTHGFAGGLWNTVCTHASYAVASSTHLFAEASLVLRGVVPADNVGGPPIVVTLGVQQTL
jgi:hypothetical protein